MCNDTIYEINWITEKNWNISYDYNKIENPYIINKGNFKIINNEECSLKLFKKIDYDYDIEKILINISFNYKLLNKNYIHIDFVVTNNIDNDNNHKIISTITFYKSHIIINNNKIKLNNEFNYELLLNFSYLQYIILNEIIKRNNKNLFDNNNKINYDKDDNNFYFGLLIKSKFENNKNMDNYLNIKIL